MYSPYSSNTQRNKSRLYSILCLIFLVLIIYWRYSTTNKQTFQSAEKQIDKTIQQEKQKINEINQKLDHAVDQVKDKVKQTDDDVKKNL